MNNLDAIYDFILNELRKLTLNENFYFKPNKPKLSDLELVAINISAEYLSIDSEYQLFRYLSNSKLNGMIERSVYNRRKRKLFLHMKNIRKIMVTNYTLHVLFQEYFKVLIFLLQAFMISIFCKT